MTGQAGTSESREGMPLRFMLSPLLQLIFIGGLALRLYAASLPGGTDDMMAWAGFARQIAAVGPGAVYEQYALFNNPVPAGLLARALYAFSELFQLDYFFIFRAFFSIIDCLTAIVIYLILMKLSGSVRQAKTGYVIWLLGPISILISGYHGNTDALYVALVASALLFSFTGRYFVTGLIFGLCSGVKLLPLVSLPTVLCFLADRKSAKPLLAGICLGLIPCLSGVLFGWSYIEHVFLYSPPVKSYWGVAGLLQLAAESPSASAQIFSEALEFYKQLARFLIIAALTVIPVFMQRKKYQLFETLAVTFVAALLLSPGIGPQYFSLACLYLLLCSWKDALVLSCTAAVYEVLCLYPAVATYYADGRLESYSPSKLSVFWGFIIYAALVDFLIRLFRRQGNAA